jgi:hypothetical protein
MILAAIRCSKRIYSLRSCEPVPTRFAEAPPDEQLASRIGAHVRAFEFYQGVAKLVVPDNAPRHRKLFNDFVPVDGAGGRRKV